MTPDNPCLIPGTESVLDKHHSLRSHSSSKFCHRQKDCKDASS